MNSKIRIIIAEDHHLMRTGYKTILEDRNDYRVIGEAANGKELLDLLALKQPDVILLDLDMPVMSGGEALQKIKQLYPTIKIIIISIHFSDGYIVEYFLKGINGYLSKNCEPQQLCDAIDAVMGESYYFSAAISKQLLAILLRSKKEQSILYQLKLNETEIQVLGKICEDKSTKQIAEELGLGTYAVDHLRRKILEKTQQSSVLGLYKFAIKYGIAELNT